MVAQDIFFFRTLKQAAQKTARMIRIFHHCPVSRKRLWDKKDEGRFSPARMKSHTSHTSSCSLERKSNCAKLPNIGTGSSSLHWNWPDYWVNLFMPSDFASQKQQSLWWYLGSYYTTETANLGGFLLVLFVQWHFCQKVGKQTKNTFYQKMAFAP